MGEAVGRGWEYGPHGRRHAHSLTRPPPKVIERVHALWTGLTCSFAIVWPCIERALSKRIEAVHPAV